VGLATMVCADNLHDAISVAGMEPNIIIAEAPELIGAASQSKHDPRTIAEINQAVWNINPDIRVLHAAGISCGQDVYDVISAGAQGSGSTSGIFKAQNPSAMLEEMIQAARAAWDATH
jgi:triosephosphate isomerase